MVLEWDESLETAVFLDLRDRLVRNQFQTPLVL